MPLFFTPGIQRKAMLLGLILVLVLINLFRKCRTLSLLSWKQYP